MSDQCEEQEMEAEALEAIFDTAFEIRSSDQPFVWAVKLVPIDCGGDADEEEVANHVMVNLIATVPLDYPEVSLPQLDLEIIKGLSEDNKQELLQLANEEAEANEGMSAIFAVCEAVRGWLADNNVKGLDDASMHAQMMRKRKEAERQVAQAAQQFESQKKLEVMSQAEKEELEVRKRREEGTPVTLLSFTEWWAAFTAEMKQKKADEKADAAEDTKGDKKTAIAAMQIEERRTGFQIFSDKAGVFNLEKLEAAAEEMENDTSALDAEEMGDVDEVLFDDDEDLDDLDFDSDEDDEDSDDEPDI
mmetsp:Transcript_21028/g.37728  ORF Transcript_21028/g.37728 Transcript_21028/m.37728 type:complete len:304 (+) Transcript_21028:44-955(+)